METPVNMAKLYSYMKVVLNELGLNFKQMDEIQVIFHENHIEFRHGNAWIATSAAYIEQSQ